MPRGMGQCRIRMPSRVGVMPARQPIVPPCRSASLTARRQTVCFGELFCKLRLGPTKCVSGFQRRLSIAKALLLLLVFRRLGFDKGMIDPGQYATLDGAVQDS